MLALEPGRRDQQNEVLGQRTGQPLQGLGSVLAGLAGGNAQVEHAPGCEQRQAVADHRNLSPIESGFDKQYTAFVVALLERRGANAIGSFEREQQLLAEYDLTGFQPARDMPSHLLRINS